MRAQKLAVGLRVRMRNYTGTVARVHKKAMVNGRSVSLAEVRWDGAPATVPMTWKDEGRNPDRAGYLARELEVLP